MEVQDLGTFSKTHSHEEIGDLNLVNFRLHVSNVAKQELIIVRHLKDFLWHGFRLHRQQVLQGSAQAGIF
jgi:hypothetical protein